MFGRTRTHNLSLPILGKYTFRPRTEKWRPFITTGYELGKSWNEFESRQVYRDTLAGTTQTFIGKSSNRSPLSNGIVIGGGVDYRFRRFYVAPEFRYTFQNPTNSGVESRHRADLLLSIRF
ncbi:MAG: outer membrane beta-barrel protein [Acidobacteria bacterium]|nr:outer membrane beta-barrel protein [Acidobacteriota bacterium]